MVASSAASALAFDAAGRRFDVWVGDMIQKKATKLFEKHDRKSDAAEIIDKCGLLRGMLIRLLSSCFFHASLCCVSVAFQSGGLRAGDLVDACNDLKFLL